MANKRFRAQRKWAREWQRNRMWLNALNRRWQASKVQAARQVLEATTGPIPVVSNVRFKVVYSADLDCTTGTALIRGIDQDGNPVEDLIAMA